jgi:hypothetical protein
MKESPPPPSASLIILAASFLRSQYVSALRPPIFKSFFTCNLGHWSWFEDTVKFFNSALEMAGLLMAGTSLRGSYIEHTLLMFVKSHA